MKNITVLVSVLVAIYSASLIVLIMEKFTIQKSIWWLQTEILCFLERAENHQIPNQLIKRGKDFSENLEKTFA